MNIKQSDNTRWQSEVKHFDITPKKSITRVGRAIQRIFRDLPGNIEVRLWHGETLRFGSGTPEATLVFNDPHLLRDLALFRDPLRLAEAYFQGELDVEGDLYKALRLKDYFHSLCLSVTDKVSFLYTALTLGNTPANPGAIIPASSRRWHHLWRDHSKKMNRKAIAFHYNVSNDFYKLWLDENMVYSCAYFEQENDTLDQAQRNKLDHICRKLHLEQGERLLDIGCGWGALITWAAKNYGVRAHGITLSREQYEYCLARIEKEGLQERVTVELKDYRDLEGSAVYDKVVSVGMFEHVGLKNLPRYFSVAKRMLKPGGLFLNHGITQDQEGWHETVGTRFINRYVFPDGELDTVSNVKRVMEREGFEIHDIESLRAHYAMTLRHWVSQLEARKDEALQHVHESIFRVWRLYMAACALQFEQGEIGVYQILAVKKDGGLASVPLTRRDLYK